VSTGPAAAEGLPASDGLSLSDRLLDDASA
jgi:hypothetical protein